jgi:hypothetical protein
MSMSMLIMQLADSAFPAGGLNHSQGLEAAMQSGRVQCAAGLKLYAIEVLQLQVTASPTPHWHACVQCDAVAGRPRARRGALLDQALCSTGFGVAAFCDGWASRSNGGQCGTALCSSAF